LNNWGLAEAKCVHRTTTHLNGSSIKQDALDINIESTVKSDYHCIIIYDFYSVDKIPFNLPL